jgi:hypothetical protein
MRPLIPEENAKKTITTVDFKPTTFRCFRNVADTAPHN